MAVANYLKIVGDVAIVAGHILNQFTSSQTPEGRAKLKEDTPFRQGDIEWLVSLETGNTLAINRSQFENGICFSLSSDLLNVSDYLVVEKGKYVDVDSQLAHFVNGECTIGRTTLPKSDTESEPDAGVIARAIAFNIRLLGLGTFVTVVPGVTIIAWGQKFGINFDKPPLHEFKWGATIKDGKGGSANIGATVKPTLPGAKAETEFSWDFPIGFHLDQIVEELTLTLEMSETFYQSVTAESRKKMKDIPEALKHKAVTA